MNGNKLITLLVLLGGAGNCVALTGFAFLVKEYAQPVEINFDDPVLQERAEYHFDPDTNKLTIRLKKVGVRKSKEGSGKFVGTIPDKRSKKERRKYSGKLPQQHIYVLPD